MVEWYEVDDAGRFLYRRGELQGAKGWGKSPLGAALAVAEFCGPVRFSHFDSAGEPIAAARESKATRPPGFRLRLARRIKTISNVYAYALGDAGRER